MKRPLNLRSRLLVVMLSISLAPTLLLTLFSTISSYSREYRNIIRVNIGGMEQAREIVDRFVEDMKRVFYAMEFSPDYKGAVEAWYDSNRSYENSQILRDALLGQLNQHRTLKSIQLFSPGSNYTMYARRSGVEIREASAALPGDAVLLRPMGLQTNLFFRHQGGEVMAVHNMHRFIDRTLLAQLQVEVHREALLDLLGRLRIYGEERIYLVNDQGEPVLSLQEGANPGAVEEEVGAHFRVSRAGEVEYFDRGGTLVFSSFHPEAKLGIVKYVPRRNLAAAVWPTLLAGVALGLLTILVVSLLAVALSRRISRPMEELARRVRNIKLETLVLESAGKREDGAPWRDEVEVLEEHISLFVDQIRRLIKEEYAGKLRATAAQIEALQSQINPHFLHNTLQLIGSIALARDAEDVYTISSSLSRLMRYALNMQEHQVRLEQELQFLDLYLYIQNQRFQDRFQVEKLIDSEAQECLIPKLLLQPIVENAFQHGFSAMDGAWCLRLRGRINEGYLIITVEDNGAGMSSSQLEELNRRLQESGDHVLPGVDHIGLQNVHARIRLLYGEPCGLTVARQLSAGGSAGGSKGGSTGGEEERTVITLKLRAQRNVVHGGEPREAQRR